MQTIYSALKLTLRYLPLFLLFMVGNVSAQTKKEEKKLWKTVRQQMPEYKKVFKQHDKYRFEIIYGRVNHQPAQLPSIQFFHYGNDQTYFYPASTVKLPVALRSLQKLNRIEQEFQVKEKTWFLRFEDSSLCGSPVPPTKAIHYLRVQRPLSIHQAAASCKLSVEDFLAINPVDTTVKVLPGQHLQTGRYPEPVSIQEMINEMLVYSNNNAYNVLFDFSMGETCLTEKGIKIAHRFRPCIGYDVDNSKAHRLYNSDQSYSSVFASVPIINRQAKLFQKGYDVGRAVVMTDSLTIHRPKNFTSNNAMQLQSVLNLIIELNYPGYLPANSFYTINDEQRKMLLNYLCMRPREDKYVTDTSYLHLPDNYTNYLYTGQRPVSLPKNIRIINIVGQSYGFITDCMYFVDEDKKIDFFLAARIYANSDGVLNDDAYEYETLAFPLFEALGKTIYGIEEKRQKEFVTNPGWLFQIFQE